MKIISSDFLKRNEKHSLFKQLLMLIKYFSSYTLSCMFTHVIVTKILSENSLFRPVKVRIRKVKQYVQSTGLRSGSVGT